MPIRISGIPARLVLATGVIAAAISTTVLASGRPAPGAATPRAPAAAPSAQADDYVGQDTCLTCHEDRNYKGTLHALTSNPKSPASTHGCESCHGPGKAHAEAGGDKTKIVNLKTLTQQRASETCVNCHDRSKHGLWSGSQHDQRNVGCLTCHSVHSPVGPKQLKAASEPELCATCHRNIVNKLHRFNHMPVREDKMQCSSCHNPHGSTNTKLLKTGTTVDESCTSCHTEKRGPYLWEHAPVANACVTCHDPHGSNNERMLAAKVPFLCQRCHVTSRHPPTVYEGFLLNNSTSANKMFGRGCVVCHQQIHGSNAPSGKAFLR
ncbi:MAG: DmsE family decaheme c-type cytochrome [Acidobacteria bacterium]|nr:DmsE family decaheme c-type cytochrome [Acidobacteriota bacterium]